MIPEQIAFWHWWIVGVLFVIAEIFAPGFILLWLGVAAGAVGAILLAVPGMTWQGQMLIFAVLSVGSAVAWRIFPRRRLSESDRPTLNRRGTQYVGRVFTLDEGIIDGIGMLKVDDTRWKVRGEDLPPGTRVAVTAVRGTVLVVEKAREIR